MGVGLGLCGTCAARGLGASPILSCLKDYEAPPAANIMSGIPSFLALEGLHVFVTGAAGGIGSQVVREFLCQ